VALIGAIFVELGKLIKDVIELLSLLLHFEEILATYKILQPHLLGQVNALATVIPSQIFPAVKSFFQMGEQEILADFCTVKKQVDPSVTCGSALRPAQANSTSSSVSTFAGIGATAHTIFTVAPKSGGPASSHAVHATWGCTRSRTITSRRR
jgi:hypothetical protein